jgi:hypothetical protein
MTALIIALLMLVFIRPTKSNPRQRLMILLFAPLSIYAQIWEGDTLPHRSELFASLRKFHDDQTAAKITEFQVQEKFRWMNWTPTIGIGYNLQGQPRPTIAYSLGTVKQNLTEREKSEAKKAAILRGALLEFRNDSFALVALLNRHRVLLRALKDLEQIQLVDDEAFEIVKRKRDSMLITPSVFLAEKAAFMRRGQPLTAKYEEIQFLKIEILKAAKF